MPDKDSVGERLVRALAVAIFLFVAVEATGANWCRDNYPHGHDTNSYRNEDYCAANGGVWFVNTVRYIVHENREDFVAAGTIILAVFTIILALAARQQAILTRGAVDAAVATAKIAESALIDVERPYIFVLDVHRGRGESPPKGPTPEGVCYTVVNLGKTPAIINNVRVLISQNRGLAPRSVPDVTPDPAHPLIASHVFSPNDPIMIFEAFDTDIDREWISNPKYRIKEPPEEINMFFWIIIKYSGVFTNGHSTSACWLYNKLPLNSFRRILDPKYSHME